MPALAPQSPGQEFFRVFLLLLLLYPLVLLPIRCDFECESACEEQ